MKNTTYTKILIDNNLMPTGLLTKKNEPYANLFWSLYRFYNAVDNGIKQEKYYLKSWTRSKGHYHLIDEEHNRMIKVLDAFGVKYEEGNDAERGGLEGDYIIAKYDYRSLKNIKKAWDDFRG